MRAPLSVVAVACTTLGTISTASEAPLGTRADRAAQVCAPTSDTELSQVICIPEEEFLRYYDEWTRDQPYWPYTAQTLKALVTRARGELGPGQALVADCQYRLHARDIAPQKDGYHFTLSTPIPPYSAALTPTPAALANSGPLYSMDVGISTDSGVNTGGDLLYGPPSDGGPFGLMCTGYAEIDGCKNCCFAGMSVAMEAVIAAGIKCHAAVNACPWCHLGCGVAEAIAAGLVWYAFDKCSDKHCSKQYWNDTSVDFSGSTKTFMLTYNWGDLSPTTVVRGKRWHDLQDANGVILCSWTDLGPAPPVLEELEHFVGLPLRVAYDGATCNIRDYRVLPSIDPASGAEAPPPLVGRVRYDPLGAWFLLREGRPELQILKGSAPPEFFLGWRTGTKVALTGDVDEVSRTIRLRKAQTLRDSWEFPLEFIPSPAPAIP
jgi:hypothetical protein